MEGFGGNRREGGVARAGEGGMDKKKKGGKERVGIEGRKLEVEEKGGRGRDRKGRWEGDK